MSEPKHSYSNVIRFILSENLLTISVIGSVITFQFLSTFKLTLIDPLLNFALPHDKFNFMNITLKDGDEPPIADNKISLDFGLFFKEFVSWTLMIVLLFILAKYTRFPDTPGGNVSGAAIM